ncbi:hypothetical protein Tco_0227359 [Tanacetum coccineum]
MAWFKVANSKQAYNTVDILGFVADDHERIGDTSRGGVVVENVSSWDTVSVCDMYTAGLALKTQLSEVNIANEWRWPTDWTLRNPRTLSLMPVPMLQPARSNLS